MDSKASVKARNMVELANLFSIDHAEVLQRYAKRLHHLHECECNYGLTPRQETRERKIIAAIGEISRLYKVKIRIQGDPRSWPLIIGDGDATIAQRVCPY